MTVAASRARVEYRAAVDEASAILLTGVYGVGKSSVAAEVAGVLEARGVPYAAFDLDWLAWSNVAGAGHDEAELLASNLAAVVANVRARGAARLVLAGCILDEARLAAVRAAVGVPLRVVVLTAPVDEIERRLLASPESGRADDLREAIAWLAAGHPAPPADAVVDNAGPLADTAARVLAAVGWDDAA